MERPVQKTPLPVTSDEDSAYQQVMMGSWAIPFICLIASFTSSRFHDMNFRPESHHLAAMVLWISGLAMAVIVFQVVLVVAFNLKRYATTKLSVLGLLFMLIFPVAFGFGILALEVPDNVLQHQNYSHGIPFELQGTVFDSSVFRGRGGPNYNVYLKTTTGEEVGLDVSWSDFHRIDKGSVMHIHGLKSEYGSSFESWTIEPGK